MKLHKKSDQAPPICKEIGSKIRTDYLEIHLKSNIHTAACKANRLSNMSKSEFNKESSTFDNMISRIRKALFGKIGSHMVTILMMQSTELSVLDHGHPAKLCFRAESNSLKIGRFIASMRTPRLQVFISCKLSKLMQGN